MLHVLEDYSYSLDNGLFDHNPLYLVMLISCCAMPHRCYQLCIPLLILLNLLLQSCQAPSDHICTETVPLGPGKNSEIGCQDTFSPLSLTSLKSTDSLAPAISHASSGQVQISVSKSNRSLAIPMVRLSSLAGGGRFSEKTASLSDMQTTSATVQGIDACPAPVSSLVEESDTFFPVPSRSHRTSSGECVVFRQVAGHWQAVLQPGFGIYTSKQIIPVVSKGNIAETLSWLQAQDPWVSRSRVHLLSRFRAPYNLCVYLGKHGLLGGVPEQEKKPGWVERYHHERAEREKLQQEQVVLRTTYERKLYSLEQTNTEYRRAYELLATENSDLRSNIEELEDYRKKYEATFTSLVQERDMYKEQYEELQAEYLDLKSYVSRYQGPERVLFQPSVSGAVVFGQEAWVRYFGDTGVEPPLPFDIDAILNSACPFWPGSKVKDTHLLVLIPATVHDRPFTLDLLECLIENPHSGGYSTKCCYQSDAVKEEFGSQLSSCNPYWILVTRSILPDSQCKTFEEQESLIADYSCKTGLHYVVPSPLEAATAILSHHARSGERICPNYPRMYTRCAGKVDYIYPVYMGLFSLEGLNIGIDDYDSSSLSGGTLCLRKL